MPIVASSTRFASAAAGGGALAGFTRFEAAAEDVEGELEMGVLRASLAREVAWLPAVENKGEGIEHLVDRRVERVGPSDTPMAAAIGICSAVALAVNVLSRPAQTEPSACGEAKGSVVAAEH